MLKRDSVFVIGAAFSSELGLPLGNGLKAKIIDLLPTLRRESRDTAFAQLVDADAGTLSAIQSLRAALPLAASIDNLVEHRRDDPDFIRVAKWGIARAIALSEQGTVLGQDGPLPQGTSYEALFQLIVSGVDRRRLDLAFSRLKLITFNYDRTLEVFLHRALRGYSGLSRDEATEVLNQSTILHAYGALGANEQGYVRPIAFEPDDTGRRIVRDADGLRTFSEKADSQSIGTIRDLVDQAERLIFLGCAFHAQNLELIQPNMSRLNSVFATAYSPPPADPFAQPAFDRFSLKQALPMQHAVSRWPSMETHIHPSDRIQFAIEAMTCRQLIAMYGGDWRD